MNANITITIEDLERIIKDAKANAKRNKSLILCVEFEKGKSAKVHGKSDVIKVWQLCAYAECNPETLLYINF
jgi:hypothetical protein